MSSVADALHERPKPVHRRILAFIVAALFLFSFLLLLVGQASAQHMDWKRVDPGSGFGFMNWMTTSMQVYDGGLYVGTFKWDGTQVWSYDGTDWAQVNTDGFGDPINNEFASAMAVYGGRLYVGTASWVTLDGCEVWEYDPGRATQWKQVNPDGFGTADNEGIYSMAVYDGRLFAGTFNWNTGTEIWAYNGNAWSQVSTDGFGDVDNEDTRAMEVFDGRLYAGTSTQVHGTEIWEYDPDRGTPWQQVNTNGFGDAGNASTDSMAVYDGLLYAGTTGASGCEVWEYYPDRGTPWQQINTDGFGTVDNINADCMSAYAGELFVGTMNPDGGQVWSYDGQTWGWQNSAGFGNPLNQGCDSFAVYQQRLYAGTWNNDGIEIWRNVVPVFEVVKSATPTSPLPGDELTYTIDITNNGDGKATEVLFTDLIPEGTTYVPNSVTCSDENAKIDDEGQITVSDITIQQGKSVTITFKVTIDADVEPGSIVANQGFIGYRGTSTPTSNPDNPGKGQPTDVRVFKTLGSEAWIVAEGSTAGGFDTWIVVQNANLRNADVAVAFSTEAGIQDGTLLTIPPQSRSTLRLSDYMPDEWSVSTLVASEQPIVVERSMYWDLNEDAATHPYGLAPYEMKSGHANLGLPAPSQSGLKEMSESGRVTSRYFPEGSTSGFDTWVLLMNPNDTPAEATVTLMDARGPVVTEEVEVGALSRETVHLNDLLPNANEVATQVTSDKFLVAERSMYWDPEASTRQPFQMIGGHSTSGSPAPHTDWYIAEGATADGFETYVLLQNPNDVEAAVTVDFHDADAVTNQANIDMPPQSRATVRASDYMPDDFQVSTMVTSDVPVVAERSMYWDKREACGPCGMKDGHSNIGETGTSGIWLVPEGSTGGGFDSFVLVTNTEATEADVEVTFMTQDGAYEPFEVQIPMNSRYTIWLNEYLPDEYQVSTLLVSENQLVVERSMYWDDRQTSPYGNFPARPFECIGGHSAGAL